MAQPEATPAAPIEFPSQNIALVGALNPAILTPEWALAHLPLPAGSVETFLNPQRRQVMHRVAQLIWVAERDKLVVYGPTEQTSAFVRTLAEKLPHTPFRAIGVNFLMRGVVDREALGPWRLSIAEAQVAELLGGASGEITLTHSVTREDDVRLTLKAILSEAGPNAVLDFNFHRQLTAIAGDNKDRVSALKSHAARAPEFEEDAKRISSRLWQQGGGQ